MQQITYADGNKIIRDALNIECENTFVSARMGKDIISIFNKSIESTKNEPLYVLCPIKTDKVADKWLHDISSYKIYKITKKDFNNLGIDIDYLPGDRTRVNLNEDWLVYENDFKRNQEVIVDRNLTIQELVCITLKVPESGTEWIDTLIRKSISYK